MPLKERKQASVAFYHFLVEFKEEAVKNGYDIEIPEFEEEAEVAWRNLSPQSRIHYELIAFEKRKTTDCLENKFTTTGVSYAQLQREKIKRSRQEEFMIYEIETTVRPLSGCSLKTTVFHFIHVNTYCRLLDGHFLPCEIGIAKFNFESGVKDSFHSIINLECIPTGYFLECKQNSEDTHQIPLPPNNSLGERDSEKILERIEAFLSDKGEFPPLYTLQPNIEAAQDTLTTFASGRYIFRVYPIARLLFELRNACANEAGGVGFRVLSLAEREFERDFFNLTPGISCYYHEGMDACQYCSLSIVKRWCFLFASLGCPDLGIPLKAGCHKPRKIALPPAPPEPTTSKTQVSSRRRRKGAPKVIPPAITIVDHSSSKPPADAGNAGDSPLAQFGTYIRAVPEESEKVHGNYNDDTTCPSSNGNTTDTPSQNLKSWCKSYVCQEKCVKSSSKEIKQHAIESDVKEQVNTIVNAEEQQNHPYFVPVYQSQSNVTDTKLQRFEIAELYSQFVSDANEVHFQNCESVPKQPPDIFDTYVERMFKPIQKQPSDITIKSKPVEKYEALQLGSLPHQFRKEDSLSFVQTRNDYLGYNTENCGRGRAITKKSNIKNLSPIRPIVDYSSSKPSADARNEGSNVDSPLAQFGTYMRAVPEESEKVHGNYNDDTTCPSSNGNTTDTPSQNLKSWSKSYVCQEKCVKSSSKEIKQHAIERDVKEQVNTIVNAEEQQNHPYFVPVYQSQSNVTDTKLQRFEIAELYSQFVSDANEVHFQNCESIPKQPPDIFDTYVERMFKPIQKQPSGITIKSKPVEKYEALQLGSLPHQFRKEDSLSFVQTRNDYLGYNTENCGHGRAITKKSNIKNPSPIRPGQEVLDDVKTVLQNLPATKVEEQELTRNGVSRSIGRGCARVRRLSDLLE